MPRHLALLVVALATAGCCGFLPGDGAFSVEGQLPDDATRCHLELTKAPNTDAARLLERRLVDEPSGPFTRTFVVSPCDATYAVALLCDGRERARSTVRYPDEVSIQNPLILTGSDAPRSNG